jgi:peptidoglycan hydrolase-like protein with peptidoglycan-binding domain
MNQEVIFRKALLSSNPQAILEVIYAFDELGEIEKTNALLRHVALFHGMSSYEFGYDIGYYTAVQKKLNDLGTSPPLVIDGNWGPKSKAACITFQKSKGLVPDGVPGTKTLAALGIKAPTQVASSVKGHTMPATVNSDATAYAAGKQAGAEMGLTEPEVQYVVAVARGEGGYGNGWGTPSAKTLAESKTFGITGYEGVGSNNWGAVQGTGNAGSFPHVDHDAKGKAYLGHYKKYATHADAFKDMAHTILGGGPIRKAVGAQEIKSAIAEGNLRKAVYAQHANGYFELAPEAYLSTVINNYTKILDNIGWPKVLAENGITPGIAAKVAGGTLALWGLTALGIFLFRKPLGLVGT